MKRIFIILKEDIIDYPPILSILKVLLNSPYKVIHLGCYSDNAGKEVLMRQGVEFVTMPSYDGNGNFLKKLYQQLLFRWRVKKYLKSVHTTQDDLVWLVQAETIYLLGALVKKYKTICYALEFFGPKVGWKYRLLSPFLDLAKTLQNSYKVVCCEYNRAQIAKGLFQLNLLPVILPNKITISDNDIFNPPEDIKDLLRYIKMRTNNRRIILYQGIFLDKERRLEEFCQAMDTISQEYIFVAMGRGSDMYTELKKKYEGDRILFIPFIKPPYHLLVTQMAFIGILSYFPRKGDIEKTLNPLYCAPNKIFEYSRYGIPMISNDVPALKYVFMEYHCGCCVDYPMTTEQIVDTVMKISTNYDAYKQGARSLYGSVDVNKIINKIVE